MKRDKTTSIPFAWYWQGRPLRRNQIRPVYTGTHHAYASNNPSQYPCCVDPVLPPSHSGPDNSNSDNKNHPSNHRSSKSKSGRHQQLHTPEPECHTSDTCCEPAPAPAPGPDTMKSDSCFCSLCQSENEHHKTTSCSSSTCGGGGAAAAGTSATSPSSIHYHAHAYLGYYPGSKSYYEYPSSKIQPPCPNPASCSSFLPYLYQGYCFYPPANLNPNPTNKHEYSYGYRYGYEYPCCSPSSSQDCCGECYPGEFQCHRRQGEDKDTGDDDASSVSSYTDSDYSDCTSHVDGEESCECCTPAWKYYGHPAYRVKRV